MEIVTLIDSDGKEKRTTKTAWEHPEEQARLKKHWKLKPEVAAEVASESTDTETSTKKTNKKNG